MHNSERTKRFSGFKAEKHLMAIATLMASKYTAAGSSSELAVWTKDPTLVLKHCTVVSFMYVLAAIGELGMLL